MQLDSISNGAFRTRVVLRETVAVDLISRDVAVATEARGVIVQLLASSALRSLIADRFPNRVSKATDDQFEAHLHQYTSGVVESYFAASLATGSDEDTERHECLALTSLQNALEEIPRMRRAYIRGGDLDRFFHESAVMIARVLSFLAALFGAYKGRGLELPPSNSVLVILRKHGLDKWADLFRSDLEAFDAGLEQWVDYREVFFVHRHFQRLMAEFGIMPDRYAGPGVYVHVPWIPADGSS